MNFGSGWGVGRNHKIEEEFSEKILFKQADMALFRARPRDEMAT